MDSGALKIHGFHHWAPFTLLSEPDILASLPTSSGVYVILLPQPEQRRRVESIWRKLIERYFRSSGPK